MQVCIDIAKLYGKIYELAANHYTVLGSIMSLIDGKFKVQQQKECFSGISCSSH